MNHKSFVKMPPKEKKKTHSVEVTFINTLDSLKENLPLVDRIKCAECEEILISDVEDDGERNIGCDKCIRWYHLKCTNFVGLSYLAVKDKYLHVTCVSSSKYKKTERLDFQKRSQLFMYQFVDSSVK